MNKSELLQKKIIEQELMYMAGVLGMNGMPINKIKYHIKKQNKLLLAAFKEIEKDVLAQVHCSQCGNSVCAPSEIGVIQRAWIECPECVDKDRKGQNE